jgi:sugar lactone lactonase YvrE
MPHTDRTIGLPLLALLLLAACAPDSPAVTSPAGSPAFAIGVSGPTLVAGFDAPEAAAYDPVSDVYLISNVGDLFTDANDGFISRLSPTGEILELRWIEGDETNPLVSPTGVMVQGRTLYIVDRTALRRWDLRTNTWLPPISLPDDGLFYNDVCSAGQGRIFVTGTDLSAVLEGNAEARGALYVVDNGSAVRYLPGIDVGNPNGCIWRGGLTWANFLPGGGVYRANPSGRVQLDAATPGLIDGVVFAGGYYYVTSWVDNAVHRVAANGRHSTQLFQLESPASLEYDPRRGQLIVPSLFTNQVMIYPLR